MNSAQDPFENLDADLDKLAQLASDPAFVQGGPKEDSASLRAERYARIARGNDALSKAGEISNGTGKPVFHASRKRSFLIIGFSLVAVGIVVVALLVR